VSFRTELDGVIFDEGPIAGMKNIRSISTQLNSGFGQDQLKSLLDVKRAMAREVIAAGGNCVADFKYGQKNGGFWQQMWSVDNVLWYGSGEIGRLK
jgi:hypothetical protein